MSNTEQKPKPRSLSVTDSDWEFFSMLAAMAGVSNSKYFRHVVTKLRKEVNKVEIDSTDIGDLL